jgi:5-methylcytosine-specific restriction endonuclease McrA
MTFDHPEDRALFCYLFAKGDDNRFERECTHLFDFRPPTVKRREFGRMRARILSQLLEKYGKVCQLRLHPDCSREKIWEPDHIIPLSTGELNKKLRNLPRIGRAKVARQSFGSNHLDDLTLACRKCNNHKKHRLLAPAKPGEPRAVLTDADWRSLAMHVQTARATGQASALMQPS